MKDLVQPRGEAGHSQCDHPVAVLPPEDHFHQRLRLLRTVHCLSQSELASRAGLHVGVIAHFETGSRLPSFKNLLAIVSALQCSADYLLGISKSPSGWMTDPISVRVSKLRLSDREYVDLLLDAIEQRSLNASAQRDGDRTVSPPESPRLNQSSLAEGGEA